jgi:hypothetical protein
MWRMAFCGTCSCLPRGSLVLSWLLARPIHGCCSRLKLNVAASTNFTRVKSVGKKRLRISHTIEAT